MTMDLRPRLGRGLAALGLLTPLALTACNNDPESGGLTINYSFAPGVSCTEDQENVVQIAVEVGGLGDAALVSETDPCDNAGGEIVIAGVRAGTHDLYVLGIDDEGDAVLDNLGGALTDDRVEIIGGEPTTMDVELGIAPARLEVRAFVHTGDGFPVACTSNSITIKGMRVQAWDLGSAEQLKSHDFDLCDFTDYIAVPDEERALNGRDFDTIRIQPLDNTGNLVGIQSEIDLGGPVGAGKVLRLDVSCNDVAETCDVQLLGGTPGTTTDDPTGDPTGGGSTGGDSTGGDSTGGADSTTG